jgi:hypothetical protein
VPNPDAEPADRSADDHREVPFADDGLAVLPDTTRDDTAAGWGEREADNSARLLEDRPPHWG